MLRLELDGWSLIQNPNSLFCTDNRGRTIFYEFFPRGKFTVRSTQTLPAIDLTISDEALFKQFNLQFLESLGPFSVPSRILGFMKVQPAVFIPKDKENLKHLFSEAFSKDNLEQVQAIFQYYEVANNSETTLDEFFWEGVIESLPRCFAEIHQREVVAFKCFEFMLEQCQQNSNLHVSLFRDDLVKAKWNCLVEIAKKFKGNISEKWSTLLFHEPSALESSVILPLHCTVRRNNVDLSENLLKNMPDESDINAANVLGETAIRIALGEFHFECIDLLLRYQAKFVVSGEKNDFSEWNGFNNWRTQAIEKANQIMDDNKKSQAMRVIHVFEVAVTQSQPSRALQYPGSFTYHKENGSSEVHSVKTAKMTPSEIADSPRPT